MGGQETNLGGGQLRIRHDSDRADRAHRHHRAITGRVDRLVHQRILAQISAARLFGALVHRIMECVAVAFCRKNSFVVAMWSTGLSIVLGVAAALAIARSPTLSTRVLRFTVHVATGASGARLWPFSPDAVLAGGYAGFGADAGYRPHRGLRPLCGAQHGRSLAQLEPTLLESSAVLGASRFYTLRRIVLPLIRPGVIAGAFIAFMSSFDNVPVSLFLRDAATDMLPIRMWQDLEGKLDVTIAALSGVLIIATVALMAVMERVTGLSKRLTN